MHMVNIWWCVGVYWVQFVRTIRNPSLKTDREHNFPIVLRGGTQDGLFGGFVVFVRVQECEGSRPNSTQWGYTWLCFWWVCHGGVSYPWIQNLLDK